jgi:hypothetical protein
MRKLTRPWSRSSKAVLIMREPKWRGMSVLTMFAKGLIEACAVIGDNIRIR